MSQSIGQRLKQEREIRFITLERASEATRIRIVFLQALEADDYSAMPSAAQGRGFLRNYAEYLDLKIEEMVAEIQSNSHRLEEMSGPLPNVNLVETEIPPLTAPRDEKSPRSLLTSMFARRPKAESLPAAEPADPLQTELSVEEAQVEAQEPKPRGGRKKKDLGEAPPPVIAEPVLFPEIADLKSEEPHHPVELEAESEAQAGLVSRLLSIFHFRLSKPETSQPAEGDGSSRPVESEHKQAAPAVPARMIFAEIGMKLRERRELISLTLDEVERHTKLRTVFVKALEEGQLDKLPSPVQTRGMLANYAAFLDLDTDTILLRFADFLQAQRYEKYVETPREKIQTQVVTSMPLLRSFIAGDLIFGVLMIAMLAALAIWGVGRLIIKPSQSAQATAPSIVEVLGGTALPTPTVDVTFVPVNDNSFSTSVAGAVNPLDAPTSATNANVAVSVFAVERVFVRISVDGKIAFEGRLAPRETKLFEADNQVVVLTGNAAALRISYNGRDLGLMGTVGEVVNRVYLISGVVTPTATLPPTATSTPLITTTPTPARTPTRTATPTAGG